MVNEIIVILGKAIIASINFLYLGSASTWPGHIALKINQDFIKDILKNSKTKIVIISGTNGKTTTGRQLHSRELDVTNTKETESVCAELAKEHGHIDMILQRKQMKAVVSQLIDYLS